MNFNKELALGADKSGISSSGVYKGTLKTAISVTAKTKTKGVEFSFEGDDGNSAKFLTIYTKKEDGTELFGLNKVMSLMGLLGVETAQTKGVVNGDKNETHITSFEDRKIALGLQKEEYVKQGTGEVGYKLDIVHFFDYGTLCTYGEKAGNKPAKTAERKIEDKLIDRSKIAAPANAFGGGNGAPHPADSVDDDLPF